MNYKLCLFIIYGKLLFFEVIIIYYKYIYRQVMHSDVPIITNVIVNKKKEEDQDLTQIKNKITIDKTNTNMGVNNPKNKNIKTEKEKNNENEKRINHEEIIIRTNKYKTTHTIIEVRLPNPYLDTECLKNNKYIDYYIKSKFKSKYADYMHKQSLNREIKTNNSHKQLNRFDKHIYFTNISNNKKLNKKHASEIF